MIMIRKANVDLAQGPCLTTKVLYDAMDLPEPLMFMLLTTDIFVYPYANSSTAYISLKKYTCK